MEAILLAIYSFFVWLIFIKLKWLPWNTAWQVTVVIIPIVGMAILILALNIVAPSSSDVRVYKYTVPIVSQVRGRVVEVPVEEGNRLVRKGDVLFRIDPTPYQLEVSMLEAQLVGTQGSQRELVEQEKGAYAKIAESQARAREVGARIELTRRRVAQYRELVATGAGNRFDLENAETELAEQTGQLDAARDSEAQARASQRQIQQKLGATVKGEFSQVAQTRAQLENARWNLEQTTTFSPCDCYVVNLALRPGGFVAGIPLNPVMTLVEADGQVVGLYHQNELHQVKPGNEVEFALKTLPGKIIKGKVDSVVWAQGAGQMQASGQLPTAGVAPMPPGRYAVKFNIAERDKEIFLAAGAAGDAAIYTDSLHAVHIIRKVILRVGSYLNYLILKLH
ncbi:MAG TPA: HlyD family secretion protein [Burkholderiales bacterium]